MGKSVRQESRALFYLYMTPQEQKRIDEAYWARFISWVREGNLAKRKARGGGRGSRTRIFRGEYVPVYQAGPDDTAQSPKWTKLTRRSGWEIMHWHGWTLVLAPMLTGTRYELLFGDKTLVQNIGIEEGRRIGIRACAIIDQITNEEERNE